MQEVPPWKVNILDDLRQRYPWQEHCATPTQCEVALLSRHPWEHSESGIYGEEGGAMAFARFGPEFGNMTVASIHLRWPFKSPQYSNLTAAYKQLGVSDGSLIIIGGDFNSTAWSTVLKGFSQSNSLQPAGNFQATWPARSPRTGQSHTWLFPHFQLDHIFVSDDIKVMNFQRGDDIGSDHLPLISEISLPLTETTAMPEAE
jgi:endonuclease/exonuclease/phosphatase (EEP) superfamily protein YafD